LTFHTEDRNPNDRVDLTSVTDRTLATMMGIYSLSGGVTSY
jgi:hypothetical protein